MIARRASRNFLSIIFTAALVSCTNSPLSYTLENGIESTNTDTLDYKSYKNYSVEQLLNEQLIYRSEEMNLVGADLMAEYQNFDPQKLEKILIEKAASAATSPIRYHEEIQELITYYQTYIEKRKGFLTDREAKPYLEDKYNVTVMPESIDPDTITYERLLLMFPQYYNMNYVFKSNADKRCPFLHLFIPPIMRHPSFGGLIPGPEPPLDGSKRETRGYMIWAHLYWLSCVSDESITLDDIAAQLYARMQKSLLPDALKFYILKKMKLIKPNGRLHDGCYMVTRSERLPAIMYDAFTNIGWATPYTN